MGIFSKLFGSKKTTEYEKDFDESVFMASHQLADGAQREKFISHTLEQMKEAADEIDILSREYDNVTAYLTDMDEIDRLPEPIAAPIKEHAKKLVKLEQERKHFTGNVIHMTDEEFALMQRFEDEMPEGYEKLKKAEEYQKLVKSDLNRMEGEKQAYFYRRNELEGLLANIKGVFFICMMAVLVLILCGCRAEQTFETVADEIILSASAQPREILLTLPEETLPEETVPEETAPEETVAETTAETTAE